MENGGGVLFEILSSKRVSMVNLVPKKKKKKMRRVFFPNNGGINYFRLINWGTPKLFLQMNR